MIAYRFMELSACGGRATSNAPKSSHNLSATMPLWAYVDPLLLDNRIEGWDAAWSEREKYSKSEKMRVAYQENFVFVFYLFVFVVFLKATSHYLCLQLDRSIEKRVYWGLLSNIRYQIEKKKKKQTNKVIELLVQ